MTISAERRPPPAASTPAHAYPRSYERRRAGVVTRFTAAAVDLVVMIVMLFAGYVIVIGFAFLLNPRSFSFPSEIGWSIPAAGFVLGVPYLTLCWHVAGRTYGNALLGLRVVNHRGGQLGLLAALLRAIACMLFPIGLVWVVVSSANRSVQDVLLRTSVVYDWQPTTGTRIAGPAG
jgi:uncharacterized RDD family membrane protein YckC